MPRSYGAVGALRGSGRRLPERKPGLRLEQVRGTGLVADEGVRPPQQGLRPRDHEIIELGCVGHATLTSGRARAGRAAGTPRTRERPLNLYSRVTPTMHETATRAGPLLERSADGPSQDSAGRRAVDTMTCAAVRRLAVSMAVKV